MKDTKFNTELEVINILRKGPATAQDLSDELMVSPQYLRQLIEPHYRTSSITKVNKGRLVFYSLGERLMRRMPRIKLPDAQTGFDKYRDLSELVPLAGHRTGGHKAVSFIPYVATKLLMAGLNYHTLQQEAAPETPAFAAREKNLKSELRVLRSNLDNHIATLKNNLKTLERIKDNEELWTLNELAKHYNHQTDPDGNTIPPINYEEVVITNNDYELANNQGTNDS